MSVDISTDTVPFRTEPIMIRKILKIGLQRKDEILVFFPEEFQTLHLNLTCVVYSFFFLIENSTFPSVQ